MSDWKSLYAASWAASAAREIRVAALVGADLGVTFSPQGLGAGRTDRVAGSADGLADYASPCGRMHLEITGPLRPGIVAVGAPLWIRPDKMAAAERALAAGATTVIAHHLPASRGDGLLRFLVLDDDLLERWRAGEFTTIVRHPRGQPERYVEIRADDVAVLQGQAATAALRAVLTGGEAASAVPMPLPVAVASTPVLAPRPSWAAGLVGGIYLPHRRTAAPRRAAPPASRRVPFTGFRPGWSGAPRASA